MWNFLQFFYIFFSLFSGKICVTGEREFPPNFRFGIATGAYQIEGAWNISGKGESVWDHFTHYQQDKVKDHSNGDVACDSYNLYKRDVEMLVELGVKYYRFSIAWSRILPNGYNNSINQAGIDYYNNLINELIKHNIEPMITMFHWDTPQTLQAMGGWTNPMIIERFVDYARILFVNYADRIKDWITFNEPFNMCTFGYGTDKGFLVFAPSITVPGIAEYQCGHNVLKAHARVYHMYNDEFRPKYKAKLGMATVIMWAEPETNSTEHKMIAEKSVQFNTGWLGHPVYSKEGDYPKVMREEIDALSKQQGFSESRLPRFTKDEIEYIKGTFDYIGVNYYTAFVFVDEGKRPDAEVPSFINDLGYVFHQKPEWEQGASAWLKLRPQGFRDTLNWVVKEYGNHEIYILENGYSSRGGLLDYDRISFFNTHLDAILDAIDDGCNVTAYTAWSLMDNFEWFNGYTERFGLYEVDFSSLNKTRTPRLSVDVYRNIIRTNRLNFTYIPNMNLKENVEGSFSITKICIGGLLITVFILVLILWLISKKKRKMNFKI